MGLAGVEGYGVSKPDRRANYKMASHSYILRWYDGESPRFQCSLRGVREDGSFWGEVTAFFATPRQVDGAGGMATNVEGVLSPADNLRFKELAASFGVASQAIAGKVTGVLAHGPMNHPRIAFYYTPDDVQSPEAQKFLAITRLFDPYLRPYYSKVT
jgi:hypothetical protein